MHIEAFLRFQGFSESLEQKVEHDVYNVSQIQDFRLGFAKQI